MVLPGDCVIAMIVAATQPAGWRLRHELPGVAGGIEGVKRGCSGGLGILDGFRQMCSFGP